MAILRTHVFLAYEHHGFTPPLPSPEDQVAGAQERLANFVLDIIERAAESGAVRDDIRPTELTRYCLHVLTAAGSCTTKASVERLLGLTLVAMRPTSANS